jgi:predicted TIM-barrel fold metal-dependent hydrolase
MGSLQNLQSKLDKLIKKDTSEIKNIKTITLPKNNLIIPTQALFNSYGQTTITLPLKNSEDILGNIYFANERAVLKFKKKINSFYKKVTKNKNIDKINKNKIKLAFPSLDEMDEKDSVAKIPPESESSKEKSSILTFQARKRILLSKANNLANKDMRYPNIFDSHFHIENYRHQGISVPAMLNMMDRIGISKSLLFGLPLRQTVLTSEQKGGNYYTDSDLPLYYYSGTDYYLAEQYRHLSQTDKERLYPMITGINLVDVGAVDDIMRLLQIYPKTFIGIGEITVHKEIVTAKIAGEKPALVSEGLNNIFDFAGEVGLVCLLHNDIDTMMAKNDEEMPRYFELLLHFFRAHSNTQIIWAHCGLGRYVKFDDKHIPLLDKILDTCPNVSVDIAWDEVAKYIVRNSETISQWSQIICKYQDRFLYGSDLIAPRDARYIKTFNHYKPLLDILPADVAQAVVYDNALALFDYARKRVNEWTERTIPPPGITYETAESNNTPMTTPAVIVE